MKDQTESKCPKCGEVENFIIEKSPFGSTECSKCNYKAKHGVFNVAPKKWDDTTYPIQQELLETPYFEAYETEDSSSNS